MANPKKNMDPAVEIRRILPQLSFTPSVVISRDLPLDSVYKRLELRLSGSFTTTYASGTPAADIDPFDNLISRIEVVVGGSRTVKSVRPYIMERIQLLASKVLGERKASAGAAAATNNNPTADAGMVFGTTGQYTSLAQTVVVPFEDPLVGESGKHRTWLDLRQEVSATLRLTCSAFSAVQAPNDATAITYGSNTLSVDIMTVEAPFAHEAFPFADFRQTTKEVTYSAQTTENLVDINRGAKLRGLAFLVRNGDATKSLANNAVSTIKLIWNGQRTLINTDFQKLQASNRAKGVQAPFASNVSPFDGFAYLDLLQGGEYASALPTKKTDGVDSLQLALSTNAAGAGATYSSYAVSVTIMTDEYVE